MNIYDIYNKLKKDGKDLRNSASEDFKTDILNYSYEGLCFRGSNLYQWINREHKVLIWILLEGVKPLIFKGKVSGLNRTFKPLKLSSEELLNITNKLVKEGYKEHTVVDSIYLMSKKFKSFKREDY